MFPCFKVMHTNFRTKKRLIRSGVKVNCWTAAWSGAARLPFSVNYFMHVVAGPAQVTETIGIL